jgi:lipopolysaccharide transport system ATP-binding protein
MSIEFKKVRKDYFKNVIDYKTFFSDFLKIFKNNEKDKYKITSLSIDYLEINRGTILGIIGPNGAGKSTFCKLLSRVTLPTTGTISFEGKVISLLEVNAGFHEQLTGLENIFLRGSILGMKKKEIENKLDQIISFSELKDYMQTPVKRYSTGMSVKLGFAIGLHLDNDILICDESLAVSDEKFKNKCVNYLKDKSNINKILIFVSHDLNLLYKLCNRILVFNKGKITNDSINIKKIIDEYKYNKV